MATSGLYVPVPAIPPRAPQVTLVGSSVQVTDEGDEVVFKFPDGEIAKVFPADLKLELEARQRESWTRGFGYWPENQSAAVVSDPSSNATMSAPANLSMIKYQPFAITTTLDASSFGFDTIDYKGRAERQLEIATPSAIESEFWTGAQAQASGWPNPYLANSSTCTTLNSGTAVSIQKGLAILQDALATSGCGGQGMIHCQQGITPNLLNTRRQGKLLLDQFDNFIVPGVGYPGTKPDGTAPAAGTSWMYATDLVMTRVQKDLQMFPDSFAEALDHTQTNTTNSITFRAERLAAAYFDGFRHFAVLVNLPS